MHWNHPVQPFHTVVVVDYFVFIISHLHRAVVRQINILHIYYKYNRFSTACGSARIDDPSKKSTSGVAAESLPRAIDVAVLFRGNGVGNRSSLTSIHSSRRTIGGGARTVRASLWRVDRIMFDVPAA